MVMKNAGRGEIIQVQGGHILRSTGRKDRHSKVFTAKGPRDRRVRLAAHTAIQFYDLQDRLGYDRPSKAVDWLIKKAQNAIEKLDELPPWNPIDTTIAPGADPNGDSTEMASGHQSESSSGYAFQINRQLGENPDSGSSFLPSSMDTQSIADTMKSFFPASSGTSSMNFQDYPPEMMARATVQTEDLCLCLHSLQDPSSSHHTPSTDQTLFPGSAPVTFGANYPRLLPWNGGGSEENREGYIFSSQPMPPQPFLCHSSVLSQRGPLQSSFLPLVHAWNDHSIHHSSQAIQQSSISGTQFASQDLLQFQIHQQIHTEEQPSSASPNSHH